MDLDNTIPLNHPREVLGLSVHKILLEHDYSILKNIIHDNKLIYVKAVNADCNKVFIHIDIDNYSSVNETDYVTEETFEEIVPDKITIPVSECIQHEVCGAAFDCKDGICVLHTDNAKRNFKVVNVEIGQDDIVPYPIVKLSDIKNNPIKTRENIIRTTQRIRNTIINNARRQHSDTLKIFDEVYNKIAEHSDITETIFKNLKDDIEHYERLNVNYGPIDIFNFEGKSLIQKNLSELHDLSIKYTHELEKMSTIHTLISNINSQMTNLIESLNNKF